MTDTIPVLQLKVGDEVNVWSDVYKTIAIIRRNDPAGKLIVQYTDLSWWEFCYNKQVVRRENDE